MDFGDILRRSAVDHRHRVAAVCEGQRQTYQEMFARACRLANALAGLGCQHGDRVALLGANALETVEQVGGIALGGYVRCALYAHQTPDVNAYLLELVQARVLLVDAALYEPLRPALAGLPALEHVVVYAGGPPAGSGALDYVQLLAAATAEDPHIACAPDDLHVIRFSAGTTGRPKGIVHTNDAWLRMADEYRWVTPSLDDRDVYLAAGQLTHAAVLWLWPLVRLGGSIVVMPAFDPGEALRLIEAERVTVTLVVPTMIQVMVAHPAAATRDLSSLRCVNYGASPISETTLARAVALFGDDVLYQLYGQSEAVPITMLQPHEHDRPRSVGRPTPNTKLTIVDEDGRPLPRGTVGEIAVSTPGAMLEMWRDPEGTAARRLPDGSVLTRDMGYLDEDGFLYLADRKEDMIISGGYNIWPAELENAIAAHPAVAEVCVIGVPHEKWGETPKALIVPAAGASVDEQEIIDLTRERVGAVKRVTSVEIVDSLPKSGVGKILRREVREPYWAGRGARVGGA
ncbi:MAG TPA: AMP-binding protein [Solirubrobacteraceae bacterium]|jgi:acyl-CoA synthetase (AMP-forming)/AMP-acid ligase II|nr:AMP-binding protein [Solirubrobacteraceae bacterium]